MKRRKYEMTLADLVDRLSIVQLKAIFIPEHSKAYRDEQKLIEHDIDLILGAAKKRLTAQDIRSILIIMLTNRFIWENESKARAGGPEQDKLLKLTHSINGVRALDSFSQMKRLVSMMIRMLRMSAAVSRFFAALRIRSMSCSISFCSSRYALLCSGMKMAFSCTIDSRSTRSARVISYLRRFIASNTRRSSRAPSSN